MAEKYLELAEKKKWKWERREERRRAKDKLKQRQKNDKPNNLSKKDEYEVELYINKDQTKTYKVTVNAATFRGYPKEYEEIKLKCIRELEKKHVVDWINILSIDTK